MFRESNAPVVLSCSHPCTLLFNIKWREDGGAGGSFRGAAGDYPLSVCEYTYKSS